MVLLAWTPTLGVPSTPVGVLAWPNRSDATMADATVKLLPVVMFNSDAADGITEWATRLNHVDPELLMSDFVDYYLDRGTLALMDVTTVPPTAGDPGHLANNVIDEILTTPLILDTADATIGTPPTLG